MPFDLEFEVSQLNINDIGYLEHFKYDFIFKKESTAIITS